MNATISALDAANEMWEVIVVGAGPAGALASRQLALRGKRVLLVDRAKFPRHKVCGGCLGGQALQTLQSIGLGNLVSDLGGIPTQRLLWAAGRRHVEIPMQQGIAISRAAFDAALIQAAVNAGAAFLSETSARLGNCKRENCNVDFTHDNKQHTAAARIVVAADGLAGNFLPRQVKAARQVSPHSYIGAGCEPTAADCQLSPGTLLMACSEEGYVGVTHVESGQIDLAAAFEPHFVRTCPSLAAAANHVLRASGQSNIVDAQAFSWRGTPPLTSSAAQVTAERLFAIGDATGYVEPFTGEGIAWAMAAAVNVAPLVERAIEAWSPDIANEWTKVSMHAARRQQRFCRYMSKLLRHPQWVQAVIAILAVAPQFARPFVRWRNATGQFPRFTLPKAPFSSKVLP